MLHKVFERLNSMNKFSTKVIKCGCLFSFVLCLLGVCVIAYNQVNLNSTAMYTVGANLIHISIVTFAEVVIASLIMDFFGELLSEK